MLKEKYQKLQEFLFCRKNNLRITRFLCLKKNTKNRKSVFDYRHNIVTCGHRAISNFPKTCVDKFQFKFRTTNNKKRGRLEDEKKSV